MNDKTQDGQERSSRGVVWVWVCWLAVILVLYVLSSGPAAMMEAKGLTIRDAPLCRFLDSAYSPLSWAYQHTPLQKPLGMYWHLWTPANVDIHGNRRGEP